MSGRFVVGARGSRLSRRQVEIVIAGLKEADPSAAFEFREIKTEGDRSAAPLSEIGGLGVFTKAIEDALLAQEIDIAVHSLKDLPPRTPDGLMIGAVPVRGDVRDALVSRPGVRLDELAPGARVGTGSERRAVQLNALRPDLEFAGIRGNVDTRIRKVESGEYDAAVLALAGLERLGLEGSATQTFTTDEVTPAVGQAALAVEIRADDKSAAACVRAIDDAASRMAVEAERAFLDRLGAGCRLPVGAYARTEGGTLRIAGMMGGEGGVVREEISGSVEERVSLGVRLAERMMDLAGGG